VLRAHHQRDGSSAGPCAQCPPPEVLLGGAYGVHILETRLCSLQPVPRPLATSDRPRLSGSQAGDCGPSRPLRNGTTWSISYQEGDKHWINSNMFYSIATILRTDIAIATRLQAGITKVCQVLQIHRAGPDPAIPHPANLMPPMAKCQWAPQPPPGAWILSKVSLITMLDRPRQTGTEQIPTRVIHSNIGSHFRANKPLTLDQQPPST
jgi:hypothetical protein